MSLGRSARWYVGAGLAAVLVLAAGWFLLVSPQRSTADEIQGQVVAQQQANLQTEAEIQTLKAQFKDLPDLQKQTAAIRTKLPTTPSMASLLRQMSTLAKTSGVTLVSVTPQQPAPLVTSGRSAARSSLDTPGQVNAIPVGVGVTGKFANVRLFLSGVEKMKRAMLVTSLSITRDDGASASAPSGQLKVAIDGSVFIANKGTLPAASTTGSGTAAGGTATDTTPAS